jgi:hypothetical protein
MAGGKSSLKTLGVATRNNDPRLVTGGRHSTTRRDKAVIRVDLKLRLVIRLQTRWIAALLFFLREKK